MFPDASNLYWGRSFTQVSSENFTCGKAVQDKHHKSLTFFRRQFKRAYLRGPVMKKEGDAIGRSLKRDRWMLNGREVIFRTIEC